MRSSLFTLVLWKHNSLSTNVFSQRHIFRNAYKAICVKQSSCMTRGQIVGRECLCVFVRNKLHLKNWDVLIRVNTVKHTNQRRIF